MSEFEKPMNYDVAAPICNECRNLNREPVDGGCLAFPESIPSEIFLGEIDHSEPVPGDNGIRFEAIPETA